MMSDVNKWKISKVVVPGGLVYYKLHQAQHSLYAVFHPDGDQLYSWKTIYEHADLSLLQNRKRRLESIAGKVIDVERCKEQDVPDG